MLKPAAPEHLAMDIMERSICSVKVGAALEDSTGIFSWGWNGVHTGFGIHAEAHAILRANKRRLKGATIYVASIRARNNKPIKSKPCSDCQALLDKWKINVVWRDAQGDWNYE